MLIAQAPAASSPATVDVVVTTAYGNSGTSGTANDYTYTDAPFVTSIQPAEGPVAGGNTVTVQGTGFTGATAVDFGATPATSFTVNSDTEIVATVPAHTAGTVDVRVAGSGGASPGSVGSQYTYLDVPVVSSLTPGAGPTTGGTSVAITGTGFSPGATVTFGGANATAVQWVSTSQLVVTSPARPIGIEDVVVTTAGGSSAAGVTFEYVARPVVDGIQPDSGPVAGGTVVTVTGSGFTGASQVFFGADPALSFTVDSSTRITAVSPGAGAPATVDLTVVTSGGTSATASADEFTYRARPQITTIAPTSGPIGGGTPVTVSGSGFTGVDRVSGGGASVPFSVVDDNTITFTTPAGTLGTETVGISDRAAPTRWASSTGTCRPSPASHRRSALWPAVAR